MPYIICEKCGGYYELDENESPDDFKSCECGGNLKYVQNINEKPSKNTMIKCPKCDTNNPENTNFCAECSTILQNIPPDSPYIKSDENWEPRKKWPKKVVLLFAGLGILNFILGGGIFGLISIIFAVIIYISKNLKLITAFGLIGIILSLIQIIGAFLGNPFIIIIGIINLSFTSSILYTTQKIEH